MATAWEVDTAVYEEKYKDVSSEIGVPSGLYFKPDGTKVYVCGEQNRTIYQYSLSTAWDISTASYDNKSKYIDEDTAPCSSFFSSDGSKMYVSGGTNDVIYQYSLSTPWDISTASYADKYKDVSSETVTPRGIYFSPDGSGMYIASCTDNLIYQYTLSTPWDVSTASYANKYKDVGSEDTDPRDVYFKPDGTKMYIMGFTYSKVHQYSLSTPWNVDTASYEDKYIRVYDQEQYNNSLFFKIDGTKMYVTGSQNDTVFQYTLIVPPPKVNAIMFGTNF